MESSIGLKLPTRSRCRSFKYNIHNNRRSNSQHQSLAADQTSKKHHIINIDKFTSVLRLPQTKNKESFTISPHENKQNIYVKTFTSFFSREYPKNYQIDNDQDQDSIKVSMLEYQDTFDQNSSEFTFFDPMNKPFRFIQNELAASTKQIKRQKYDIQMLRGELTIIKKSFNDKIQDMAQEATSKLKSFLQVFHSNQVVDQQRKLRIRKQLKLLQNAHNLNKKILSSLKNRNLDMQRQIFNCHPYELKLSNNSNLLCLDEEYL